MTAELTREEAEQSPAGNDARIRLSRVVFITSPLGGARSLMIKEKEVRQVRRSRNDDRALNVTTATFSVQSGAMLYLDAPFPPRLSSDNFSPELETLRGRRVTEDTDKRHLARIERVPLILVGKSKLSYARFGARYGARITESRITDGPAFPRARRVRKRRRKRRRNGAVRLIRSDCSVILW